MSVPIWINGLAYLPAVEHEALAAELAEWKRMRNEAMAVATSNRERIRKLEAALLAWYEESGRGAKQSTWPANLWALARAIGERPATETGEKHGG